MHGEEACYARGGNHKANVVNSRSIKRRTRPSIRILTHLSANGLTGHNFRNLVE